MSSGVLNQVETSSAYPAQLRRTYYFWLKRGQSWIRNGVFYLFVYFLFLFLLPLLLSKLMATNAMYHLQNRKKLYIKLVLSKEPYARSKHRLKEVVPVQVISTAMTCLNIHYRCGIFWKRWWNYIFQKKREVTFTAEPQSDSQGRIWSMQLITNDPLAIYLNALRYVTCMRFATLTYVSIYSNRTAYWSTPLYLSYKCT